MDARNFGSRTSARSAIRLVYLEGTILRGLKALVRFYGMNKSWNRSLLLSFTSEKGPPWPKSNFWEFLIVHFVRSYVFLVNNELQVICSCCFRNTSSK